MKSFIKFRIRFVSFEIKDKWFMTVKTLYQKHIVCVNVHPYAHVKANVLPFSHYVQIRVFGVYEWDHSTAAMNGGERYVFLSQ
jgi:hypothetical protein